MRKWRIFTGLLRLFCLNSSLEPWKSMKNQVSELHLSHNVSELWYLLWGIIRHSCIMKHPVYCACVVSFREFPDRHLWHQTQEILLLWEQRVDEDSFASRGIWVLPICSADFPQFDPKTTAHLIHGVSTIYSDNGLQHIYFIQCEYNYVTTVPSFFLGKHSQYCWLPVSSDIYNHYHYFHVM